MAQKEFEKMHSFLLEKKARFELLEHAPVFTSAEAATVRGADLSEGVKAILLKSDSEKFVLACLPGNKKIDTKKLASLLGFSRLFLASAQEVLLVTGCEIGSVSPFCKIFGIDTVFDKQVFVSKNVEFNLGLHTKSVRMEASELKAVLEPNLAEFAV